MLAAELDVEAVLEPAQGRVLAAGDGHGRGLGAGGVGLDLMLEGVVVEVVFFCVCARGGSEDSGLRCGDELGGGGGRLTETPLRDGLVLELVAVFHAYRGA